MASLGSTSHHTVVNPKLYKTLEPRSYRLLQLQRKGQGPQILTGEEAVWLQAIGSSIDGKTTASNLRHATRIRSTRIPTAMCNNGD